MRTAGKWSVPSVNFAFCFSNYFLLKGKSTLIANMISRHEYGYRGRQKHLISKQAKKTHKDNPYDPAVLEDPEVTLWPVDKLSQAESVFDIMKATKEANGRNCAT